MQADCKAPYAAGQITGGDEPSLGPTNGRSDLDSVKSKPFDIEQKRKGLLNVGKH